jgi:hypothetical protein
MLETGRLTVKYMMMALFDSIENSRKEFTQLCVRHCPADDLDLCLWLASRVKSETVVQALLSFGAKYTVRDEDQQADA